MAFRWFKLSFILMLHLHLDYSYQDHITPRPTDIQSSPGSLIVSVGFLSVGLSVIYRVPSAGSGEKVMSPAAPPTFSVSRFDLHAENILSFVFPVYYETVKATCASRHGTEKNMEIQRLTYMYIILCAWKAHMPHFLCTIHKIFAPVAYRHGLEWTLYMYLSNFLTLVLNLIVPFIFLFAEFKKRKIVITVYLVT